jgi:hypothetical protein
VGSGAITDGETDAKNASVDGPLRRMNSSATMIEREGGREGGGGGEEGGDAHRPTNTAYAATTAASLCGGDIVGTGCCWA